MRWVDLMIATSNGRADNFTANLFRLMFKADRRNMKKLRNEYPVEAEMVSIYRNECPMIKGHTVDWRRIQERAEERVKWPPS